MKPVMYKPQISMLFPSRPEGWLVLSPLLHHFLIQVILKMGMPWILCWISVNDREEVNLQKFVTATRNMGMAWGQVLPGTVPEATCRDVAVDWIQVRLGEIKISKCKAGGDDLLCT